MDLTKDSVSSTLSSKRVAIEMVSTEEAKKLKQNNCSAADIYKSISDLKENLNFEMPVDMSHGSKWDDMDEQIQGQNTRSLGSSVRLLREELRNQETALLLLKKLQRSQLSIAVHNGHTGVGSNQSRGSNGIVDSQSNVAGRLFGRQQFAHHGGKQHLYPASVHYARVQENPHQAMQAHSQRLISSTTAPRVSTVQPSAPCPSGTVQQNAEQTLAQRKALAKVAIRRQLEAALLQLPTPKFTPQEMSFIPAVGPYADFIALVGMEEAVSRILHSDAADRHFDKTGRPGVLKCGHCLTDCTPLWKPEENDVTSVICEHCTSKIRREAFQHEHTNRMKAAFSHALQQEKQIDAIEKF